MNKLCLVAILLSFPALAEDFPKPEKVSIEMFHVGAFKDSYFLQEDHEPYDKGIALLFDLQIFKGFYWDNRVWTLGNSSQVRAVGWEWDMYLRPHKKLDVFYKHHSQHVMDAPPPSNNGLEEHFPLRDFMGIRFNFYETNSRGGWW